MRYYSEYTFNRLTKSSSFRGLHLNRFKKKTFLNMSFLKYLFYHCVDFQFTEIGTGEWSIKIEVQEKIDKRLDTVRFSGSALSNLVGNSAIIPVVITESSGLFM